MVHAEEEAIKDTAYRNLLSAMERKQLPLVKYYFEKFKLDVNFDLGLLTKGGKSIIGESILTFAIRIGSLEIIQFLCDKGADIDYQLTYSKGFTHQGDTPMIIAAKYCHTDIFEYLIKRRHIDYRILLAHPCSDVRINVEQLIEKEGI